ncbi:MAG: VWA domain-containing protein [Pirellulales bacterium]|nr:VWA domain-containing protein [Pirellulales bacterium]
MGHIVRYLADFGWTLADVPAGRIAMLVAARNAAPYVEGLEIPIASQADALTGPALAEQETRELEELTAYCDRWLVSRLPTDEMDVSQAESIEDLPRIFPTQWLLEEIQPAMFYSKFAGTELLMPVWQRPTRAPQDAADSVHRRDLVETSAPADVSKQHAYVLLDTSRTMNDHDRRGSVARGLALAFLLNGRHQRARLNLRPFTSGVGDLSSGTTKEDLQAIAERVLGLPNSGQTRIQAALEQAVADIRQSGPCLRADILLITDGISRLSEKPLGEERLHTFLLGDMREGEGQAGTVATLREWSVSFHRIWTNRFAEILGPTLEDIEAAQEALDRLIDSYHDGPSAAVRSGLDRALENVRCLLREYRRSLGKVSPVPSEAADLEARLREAEQVIGAMPAAASVAEQEASACDSLQLSLAPVSSGPGDMPAHARGLWAWLRRIAVRAWQRTIRQCRRLVRRGRLRKRG